MSTLTFNTLKFANRLKTAGVPSVQAEAEAEALSEIFEANWSELATKQDIVESRQGTKHDIAELRQETKHDIAELHHEIGDLRKDLQRVEERFDTKLANLKFELLKWLIGLTIAQVGLVIGLLKFLP